MRCTITAIITKRGVEPPLGTTPRTEERIADIFYKFINTSMSFWLP